MTLDTTTRCPVCGSGSGHQPQLDGLVHQCQSCTFTWTVNDIPPPDELYNANYFTGDGYEDYYQPTARRFEARKRLRWLLRHTPTTPATLLEAGSAGGYFIEAARHHGIDAEGVEVAESAAQFATEHLGVPVHHGTFETHQPTHPYDAICAFHVLEHVEDPNTLLRTARAHLHPGGHLGIEVPNIASAAARRLGTRWPGLQPLHHRWHFTPQSLTQLVMSHGFEVISRDTTVFRYYMPARFRLRQGRHLFPADLRHTRSPRLTHPYRGDLLRLVARRPAGGRNPR